jgi:cobalamin biosynthesis Mg chelatase CobN
MASSQLATENASNEIRLGSPVASSINASTSSLAKNQSEAESQPSELSKSSLSSSSSSLDGGHHHNSGGFRSARTWLMQSNSSNRELTRTEKLWKLFGTLLGGLLVVAFYGAVGFAVYLLFF